MSNSDTMSKLELRESDYYDLFIYINNYNFINFPHMKLVYKYIIFNNFQFLQKYTALNNFRHLCGTLNCPSPFVWSFKTWYDFKYDDRFAHIGEEMYNFYNYVREITKYEN